MDESAGTLGKEPSRQAQIGLGEGRGDDSIEGSRDGIRQLIVKDCPQGWCPLSYSPENLLSKQGMSKAFNGAMTCRNEVQVFSFTNPQPGPPTPAPAESVKMPTAWS